MLGRTDPGQTSTGDKGMLEKAIAHLACFKIHPHVQFHVFSNGFVELHPGCFKIQIQIQIQITVGKARCGDTAGLCNLPFNPKAVENHPLSHSGPSLSKHEQ